MTARKLRCSPLHGGCHTAVVDLALAKQCSALLCSDMGQDGLLSDPSAGFCVPLPN